MELLIPIVVVLLIVAGAVTFGVMRATKDSEAGAENGGEERNPDGILAQDRSDLGDTAEHSGAQHEEGKGATTGGSDAPGPAGAPLGGEGEGEENLGPPATRR